jgi:hypothetical protein
MDALKRLWDVFPVHAVRPHQVLDLRVQGAPHHVA